MASDTIDIRAEKIAHMQALVSEGLKSGITKSTPEQMLAQARKMVGVQ